MPPLGKHDNFHQTSCGPQPGPPALPPSRPLGTLDPIFALSGGSALPAEVRFRGFLSLLNQVSKTESTQQIMDVRERAPT